MNPITLFLLAAVAIGLLGPALVIMGTVSKARSANDKQSTAARTLAVREADARRRAELHDARIAAENNKIVLQDLKIEIERLKLEALEREINPPAYEVKDYSS